MGVQAHVGRDALGQVRKQRLPVRVEQLGMRAEGKMVKERVRDGREGAQQKLDEFQVDHRRAMPCRHGVRRAQQPFPRAPVFPEGLRAARGEHHRAGRQADGFPRWAPRTAARSSGRPARKDQWPPAAQGRAPRAAGAGAGRVRGGWRHRPARRRAARRQNRSSAGYPPASGRKAPSFAARGSAPGNPRPAAGPAPASCSPCRRRESPDKRRRSPRRCRHT